MFPIRLVYMYLDISWTKNNIIKNLFTRHAFKTAFIRLGLAPPALVSRGVLDGDTRKTCTSIQPFRIDKYKLPCAILEEYMYIILTE